MDKSRTCRVPEMKWLAECSVAALREALGTVAPELSRLPVTVPGPAGKQDPLWHSGCVPVGDRFFVKFAWSHPAALRLAREIGVLAALAREPKVPFLPEVVASSADPLLMITRRMPGTSLFEVADSINPDYAARQLVRFLAALHDRAARQRAEAAVGTLTGAQRPLATTRIVRERLGTWIRPDQRRTADRWCDRADAVLGSPGPAVLVHGDFHGDNQVWDRDELRLVLDFENIGAAEPEYELRAFPGPGMGPGLELLTAIMRHYQQVTGRRLSPARVMAGICARSSATCCGAAKPAFRWQITGHHHSGSRTWPRASARSASTPKVHQQLASEPPAGCRRSSAGCRRRCRVQSGHVGRPRGQLDQPRECLSERPRRAIRARQHGAAGNVGLGSSHIVAERGSAGNRLRARMAGREEPTLDLHACRHPRRTGTHLDHNRPVISQPEPDHRREVPGPEDLIGRRAAEMLHAPVSKAAGIDVQRPR